MKGWVSRPLSPLTSTPASSAGGQRQRIGGRAALAYAPPLYSRRRTCLALDVWYRPRYLTFSEGLQEETGFFPTHIPRPGQCAPYEPQGCRNVLWGKSAETGRTESLFENPAHPYTQALFPPFRGGVNQERQGSVFRARGPVGVDPTPGCRFQTRCPHKMNVCVEMEPRPVGVKGDPGHVVCATVAA